MLLSDEKFFFPNSAINRTLLQRSATQIISTKLSLSMWEDMVAVYYYIRYFSTFLKTVARSPL